MKVIYADLIFCLNIEVTPVYRKQLCFSWKVQIHEEISSPTKHEIWKNFEIILRFVLK